MTQGAGGNAGRRLRGLDDGAAGCKRLGHDKGENAHDIVVAERQEAREHAGGSKGVAIAAGDHAILIR